MLCYHNFRQVARWRIGGSVGIAGKHAVWGKGSRPEDEQARQSGQVGGAAWGSLPTRGRGRHPSQCDAEQSSALRCASQECVEGSLTQGLPPSPPRGRSAVTPPSEREALGRGEGFDGRFVNRPYEGCGTTPPPQCAHWGTSPCTGEVFREAGGGFDWIERKALREMLVKSWGL